MAWILYIHPTSFLCRYRQIRLCRPRSHALYDYAPANEAADGTTWRHPYGASVPDARQSDVHTYNAYNWIELNWIELNGIEWNWMELNWIEMNRIESNRIELNWTVPSLQYSTATENDHLQRTIRLNSTGWVESDRALWTRLNKRLASSRIIYFRFCSPF